MSHIIIALRKEYDMPPIVYWSETDPGLCTTEACEDVSDYINQAWQKSPRHEGNAPAEIINFIVLPAQGFPYAIPTKFLIKNNAPIIPLSCPDVEEEKPRSIGFARSAAA